MVTVIFFFSLGSVRRRSVYVGRWSDDDGEQNKQCVSLVPSDKGRLRPLYDIEVDLDTALVSSVGGSGRAT